MKKILLMAILLGLWVSSFTQLFSESDSLKNNLAESKRDTNRVLTLRSLAIAYEYTWPDTAMRYAQQALLLSRELEYRYGEAKALNEIANIFLLNGDYSKALEIYLQSLEIWEQINNPSGIAVCLDNIGQVYIEEGEYRKALSYFFRAKKIDEADSSDFGIMIGNDIIADAYLHLQLLDSSLYYGQLAYQLSAELNDEEYSGPICTTMGNVHREIGHYDLALSYYRQALPFAEAASDLQNFNETYLGMSKLFQLTGKNDSAIYYSKKAIGAAGMEYPIGTLNASTLLSDLYESSGNSDSALKYLRIAFAANDTLFNQSKVKQLQTLTLNEQVRQQEIAEQIAESERIRRYNLQNLGIAIFIITFFFLLFTLRKKRISAKTIDFLGLLALLLLFEFISMFVYPWISKQAHDIPVIVLTGSVVAGSILVFLHKKVEHWLKSKLLHHHHQ